MEENDIEFPISLESIVHLSLNYENLRGVLEVIIASITKHDESISKLGQQSADNFVTIEDFNVLQSKCVNVFDRLPQCELQVEKAFSLANQTEKQLAETNTHVTRSEKNLTDKILSLEKRLEDQENEFKGKFHTQADLNKELQKKLEAQDTTMNQIKTDFNSKAANLQVQIDELKEKLEAQARSNKRTKTEFKEEMMKKAEEDREAEQASKAQSEAASNEKILEIQNQIAELKEQFATFNIEVQQIAENSAAQAVENTKLLAQREALVTNASAAAQREANQTTMPTEESILIQAPVEGQEITTQTSFQRVQSPTSLHSMQAGPSEVAPSEHAPLSTERTIGQSSQNRGHSEQGTFPSAVTPGNSVRQPADFLDYTPQINGLKFQLADIIKEINEMQDEIDEKMNAADFEQMRPRQSTPRIDPESVGTSNQSQTIQQVIPSQDLKTVRETNRKMTKLESVLEEFQDSLSDNMTRANAKIQEVEQRVSHNTKQVAEKVDMQMINHLKGLIENNKKAIASIRKQGSTIEAKLAEGNQTPQKNQKKESDILNLRVQELEEQLESIKKDDQSQKLWDEIGKIWKALELHIDSLEKVKIDLKVRFEEVGNSIDMKADAFQMQTLDETVQTRFEEQRKAKDIATQEQLKKSHSSLRQQITTLSNIILALKNGDDTMLAKKKLGGWS